MWSEAKLVIYFHLDCLLTSLSKPIYIINQTMVLNEIAPKLLVAISVPYIYRQPIVWY